MQLPSIFTLLAVGLSFVAAEEETTTTSTSTMTKTVTITKCNPSITNCPAESTSSYPVSSVYNTPSYPVNNSTSAYPTAYPNTTASYVPTQSYPVVTETSVVVPSETTTQSSVPTVSTGGAGGLLVQSGLMLSVLGAGVVLLA